MVGICDVGIGYERNSYSFITFALIDNDNKELKFQIK